MSGFLQSLARPLLARNERFKGIHAGETCYIIGAGASLKSMSLDAFSDHVTIGLNLICLHNEYPLLNAPYHVVPQPFIFYPYRRIPHKKNFEENYVGDLLKRALSQYPDVKLFTSISNLFGNGIKNDTFYLHHFGNRDVDSKICDVGGAFSFMKGGVYAGVGLAMSMGFKKAFLIGCDYLFTPSQDGHFYDYGPPKISERYEAPYTDMLSQVADSIELVVVTDTAKSDWLPYITYENLTGRKLEYREDSELVEMDYLRTFRKAVELGHYGGQINVKQ